MVKGEQEVCFQEPVTQILRNFFKYAFSLSTVSLRFLLIRIQADELCRNIKYLCF